MITKRLPKRLAHGEEATLVEHLGELRTRLVIAMLAIVPAFAVAFAFHQRVIKWLAAPLPDDRRLVTFGVTEPFTTSVKVSLIVALAVALPVILYQLWAFMAPAITEHAQRTVSTFVVIATVLFAAGVAFCYVIVLPKALQFLTSFDDNLYDIQIRASYYYSFAAVTLLASGLAFEMPIFILALVRLRVLTAKQLRTNRRLGYVIMVCFAVLLPTVDPVSLALEVAPLLILFESSIWLSGFMEKRWGVDPESKGFEGVFRDRE